MNLGEALLELKQMKSELSRLIKNLNLFCLSVIKIRNLKIRVENTNHNSFIDTPEGKMTIAECVILIGDLRAELSNLETLRKNFNTDDYRFNEKYSHQLSEKELLLKIHELEKRKTKLDSFLSSYRLFDYR